MNCPQMSTESISVVIKCTDLSIKNLFVTTGSGITHCANTSIHWAKKRPFPVWILDVKRSIRRRQTCLEKSK